MLSLIWSVSLARAEDIVDATTETAATTDDAAASAAASATDEPEETAAPYEPPADAKHFKFEAEVHRMLDIVVNSLYQHNDVFLRELILPAQKITLLPGKSWLK